jgi:autophagy-related protein 9
MVGLINLILLPFMLVFMSTHFFLSNAQHFHSTKSYLGPRQWSPLALWKFREFNELPHIFELRMNKANAPANSYILSFHNNYLAILADCSMYISGAFIAILLLLSFLSEDVLLYMHMGEHNLLWFLGVFSAIYAGSRSFIPDDSKIEQSKEELLNQLASHTHYFPIHWVNKANNIETKEEICDLFQYKVRIFLMEIFSVLLTPIVLLYSMPSCASAILQFFRFILYIY